MTGFGARSRWAAAAIVGSLIVGTGMATAVVSSGDDDGVTAVEVTTSAPGGTVPEPTTVPAGPTTTTLRSGVTTTTVLGATATTNAARYWGEECGDGPVTNHGQFVSGQERNGTARSTAAQSDCGRPIAAVNDDSDDDVDEALEAPEAPDTDTDTDDGESRAGSGSGSGGRPDSPGGSNGSGNGVGRGPGQ